MKRNNCLFAVYGTLKKGYGNHVVIESLSTEYLGTFVTPEKYTLFDGGFPIVERGGDTGIHCELYRVSNPATIEGVFGLEGCSSQRQGDPNNWYDFDSMQTPHGEAFIFVMGKGQSGRSQVVDSGNWQKTRRYY